jgi:hypothetical protein
MEDCYMSRVKQASKRKRLTKIVGVPALSAAGLSLTLVGSASASAVVNADVPQSLNTTPDQRFILSEEEIADVSLATFHLFDKESGIAGFTQVARGCGCGGGGGCRGGFGGCGCRGCGCAGCGGGGCGVGFGCGVGVGFGWGGCGVGGCCISWGGCRLC